MKVFSCLCIIFAVGIASLSAWQPLQTTFTPQESKWYVTDTYVDGNYLGFCMETNGSDLQTYHAYIQNGKILGESVLLLAGYFVQRICDMLGATLVSKEIQSFGEMFFAYSKKVPYQPVQNQSNVQIAVTQEGVWVGVPILYGSY